MAISLSSGTATTGDPYFRVLMALENIKIKVEPPTILKPQKLWTGKQVITSIIKTVVDTIARARFSNDETFQETYKGFNFESKSKTPGDAWGGVLDGDKEESTLIIRLENIFAFLVFLKVSTIKFLFKEDVCR